MLFVIGCVVFVLAAAFGERFRSFVQIEIDRYIPNETRQRKNRPRNITWFKPPYSENVLTDVAISFLRVIDKHFPGPHILHSVFNRNNIKVSYSCMRKIFSIIKQHNTKILNGEIIAKPVSCNCRKKIECPLNGPCLTSCVVYSATVNTLNNKTIYRGMTETIFKRRFYNHKHSFKHRKYSHETTHI